MAKRSFLGGGGINGGCILLLMVEGVGKILFLCCTTYTQL
jgi:hypothetical protein